MREFSREFLTDVCRRLKPATVDIPELPIFGAICFDKGNVYAYNDYQAVSVAADISKGERFAVPLKELETFLRTTKSETIKLEQGEGSVTFRAGRSRLKLAAIPPASFVFNLRTIARKSRCVSVGLSADVLSALEYLITAVSLKSHDPAYTGVIFSSNCAYATNGECLVRFRHKYPLVGVETVLLPGEFVRILLSTMQKNESEAFLKVFDGFAVFESGGVSLYTKLDSSIIHHDYGAVFADQVEQIENESEPLTESASALFNKIGQYAGKAESCWLTTTPGKLQLEIESTGARVRDSIKTEQTLRKGLKLSPVVLKPLTRLFKSGGFESFVVTDTFAAFYAQKGKIAYLVSAVVDKGES